MPKLKIKELKVREDLVKYFQFVETSKDKSGGMLKCLQCEESAPLKYSARQGWTNSINHLKAVHGIDGSMFKGKDDHSSTKSLAQFLLRGRKWGNFSNSDCYSNSDPKQIQFVSDIVDLVSIAGLPLNIVEHPCFISFARNLDRMVAMPSRRSLGRTLTTEARKIKRNYRKEISKISPACLHTSLDLWTSRSHHSVLGVRAHYIDDNWNLKNHSIGFVDFRGHKTAENVRKEFKSLVHNEYGIRPSQLGVIMTDNAAENVKAFDMKEFTLEVAEEVDVSCADEESGDESEEIENNEVFSTDINPSDWEYMENEISQLEDGDDNLADFVKDLVDWSETKMRRHGCTAHALQLVVRECLRKNPRASEIMRYVQQLIAFFNSTYWNQRLKSLANKGLIKIGDTRWNGFLVALQRILEEGFITKVNAVLEEAKQGKARSRVPDLITPDLEQDMVELASLLTPFLQLTNTLQSDEVTSSQVIPGLIGIDKQVASTACVKDYMNALRASLCLSLVERFGASLQFNQKSKGAKKQLLKVFANKAYVLASILDPRVKMKPFLTTFTEPYKLEAYVPSEHEARDILTEEFDLMKPPSDCDEQGESLPKEPVSISSKRKRVDDVVFFWDKNEAPNFNQNEEFELSEVERYLSEEPIPRDLSPLLYWKSAAKKYPTLSKLARVYLAFPASSGAVERLFSIAGAIARARRARIAIATIANLLFFREARIAKLK